MAPLPAAAARQIDARRECARDETRANPPAPRGLDHLCPRLGSMTEKESLDSVPTGLFIGGEWRDSSDGSTTDVEDPATGETLTSVASATAEDGRAALDAAAAAQQDWATTAPRERAEILRSAFELVTERADYFAMLM